jgi:CBS domain-containing protein
MWVKDLMNTKPITTTKQDDVKKIWKIIFEKQVSCLPVLDKGNTLIGIISEEDLVEHLFPTLEEYFFDPQYARNFFEMEENIKDISHLKAEDIMNRDIFTTTKDIPIMQAASSMLIHKVSCLPVIDPQNDKLFGIICKSDIFTHLFQKVILKEK